jgi:hypothetical protein
MGCHCLPSSMDYVLVVVLLYRCRRQCDEGSAGSKHELKMTTSARQHNISHLQVSKKISSSSSFLHHHRTDDDHIMLAFLHRTIAKSKYLYTQTQTHKFPPKHPLSLLPGLPLHRHYYRPFLLYYTQLNNDSYRLSTFSRHSSYSYY